MVGANTTDTPADCIWVHSVLGSALFFSFLAHCAYIKMYRYTLHLIACHINTHSSKIPFGGDQRVSERLSPACAELRGVLPIDFHGTLVTGPYQCTKFERNRSSRS